jgi:hypothetical protein
MNVRNPENPSPADEICNPLPQLRGSSRRLRPLEGFLCGPRGELLRKTGRVVEDDPPLLLLQDACRVGHR